MAKLLINRGGHRSTQTLVRGQKLTIAAAPDEEHVTISAQVHPAENVLVTINGNEHTVDGDTRSPMQRGGHSDWQGGEKNFAISAGDVFIAELK